ncbi:MAG: HAD-IIB family hydrolase [Anaerolineae bacterium]
MPVPWLLATDIDNTLTGDPDALRGLAAKLSELRWDGRLALFLVTGRRLDQVIPGFADEHIPVPDAVISQVGTEVFLPPFADGSPPLGEWDALLHRAYSRGRAESFLEGIAGLAMQPAMFNTPLKVSCYLDGAPDPDAAAQVIRDRVAAAPDGAGYQVVWSSGRDLDVIPAAAGKGKAIRFLIDHLGLAPRQVVVAGDSGNDRTMFDEFGCGVVVANAQPELAAMRDEESARDIYFADGRYAAGVAEGLAHYGLL